MAARCVALILFMVFHGSIHANNSNLLRITNLRYTNLDFVYTAHWDKLSQDVDGPVLYTLRVNGETLPECINIKENSCQFEFDYLTSHYHFQVEASVNGVRIAESKTDEWVSYDIDPEISAPRVNISRSGNNITAHLEFPSETLVAYDGIFKVELFQRVNQTTIKTLKEENEATDTTLSFITSMPENATICIKARIEVTDSSFLTHSSNFSQACVDGILDPDHSFPIETDDPREPATRLWLLIGVAIVIGIVLVITCVLICKKRCKNTFRQPDTEIPKNMALVIAASDEKSPSHQTVKEDKKENVCLIIGDKTSLDMEKDDFDPKAPDTDTALDEFDTLMNTREFPKDRKCRLESTDSAFCDVVCLNSDSGEKPNSTTTTDHFSRYLSVDSLFSADEGYVRIPPPHKQDTI